MRPSVRRDYAEGGISLIKDDQLSREPYQPRWMRAAPDSRHSIRLAMQQRIGILRIVQLFGLQSRPWLVRQLIGRIGSGPWSTVLCRFSDGGIGSQRSVLFYPHSRKVR